MSTEFLTVFEVAELLRVDTETIYRYLRTGKIIGGKVGDTWRVRRSDVDAFFEQNSNNGKKAPTV